jgi:heptosyltransferase-3
MSTIPRQGIKGILVIKLRNIGDVLLTTPAFKALKETFPDARITAVVPAGTEEMLSLNPNVSDIVTFKRGAGIIGELDFIRRIRAKKYEIAINMTEGDRGAILALLSGARYRIGIDPHDKGFLGKKHLFTHLVRYVNNGRHRAVMDMDILKPLRIECLNPEVQLFTSPEDDRYIEGILASNGIGIGDRVAVIHPTSRWLFKCWRDEAVAEVIDYLEGRGFRTVLTSGPDKKELERVSNIIALAKTSPLDLSGRLTLKRLAALFRKCSLFFGVDTAPMHMAAAVGTPVVALFGPSDSDIWGPFTEKRIIISRKLEFPCVPCNKDGCGGSKKSRCLDEITTREAIDAIERLIG